MKMVELADLIRLYNSYENAVNNLRKALCCWKFSIYFDGYSAIEIALDNEAGKLMKEAYIRHYIYNAEAILNQLRDKGIDTLN